MKNILCVFLCILLFSQAGCGFESSGVYEKPDSHKTTEAELLARGAEYYKAGNYSEAADVFQKVLDMNPDGAEAGEQLLLSMRKTVAAGDIRDELLLRGVEQLLRKEYKDAAESFNLILGIDPDHSRASDYLVKAKEGLKQAQAKEEAERAKREKEGKHRDEAAPHRVLRSDLGPYLVDSEGRRIPSDMLLDKKYVLLYFSASWCPPCRAYTPRLLEFYEKHSAKGSFEVILISSDRSSGEMLKYMKDYRMTWSALPYERAAQRTLSRKYNVTGIPRLIALDAGGAVIMDSASVDRNRMLEELARRF